MVYQTLNKYLHHVNSVFLSFYFLSYTIVGIVSVNSAQVYAQISDEMEFAYSVKAQGFSLGKLITNISKKGELYTIESTTKPNGMVAFILGGEAVDHCEYSLGPEKQMIGKSYTSHKDGKSSYHASLDYDWDQRQIIYNDNNIEKMPHGYILDNCNFYVAVALSGLRFFKEHRIYVFDAKEARYREFQFASVENETLSIKLGKFETQKLTLVRADNPDRRLTFWLSEGHPYSPLMVVDQRKNKKTVLKLIAYDSQGSFD